MCSLCPYYCYMYSSMQTLKLGGGARREQRRGAGGSING